MGARADVGFTGDVGSGTAGLTHHSFAFIPFGGGRYVKQPERDLLELTQGSTAVTLLSCCLEGGSLSSKNCTLLQAVADAHPNGP